MSMTIPSPVSVPQSHTVRLIGWGEFDDLATSIRALLFGHMVTLAQPVMREFVSDLFHDALWLERQLTGPMTFEWLIRASGTNLGEAARIGVQIGTGPSSQFWRVRVYRVDKSPNLQGDWHAEFTYVPLDEVPAPAS